MSKYVIVKMEIIYLEDAFLHSVCSNFTILYGCITLQIVNTTCVTVVSKRLLLEKRIYFL
jgi:hypothetical protein